MIIPGLNETKLKFNDNGQLINSTIDRKTFKYEWWVSGTIDIQYYNTGYRTYMPVSKYYYKQKGDTLILYPDDKSAKLFILDHKTKRITRTLSVDMTNKYYTKFKHKKDGYSYIAYLNGKHYYDNNNRFVTSDKYGNALITEGKTNDGLSGRMFTFVKYFNEPFQPLKSDKTADDKFYNALFKMYAENDKIAAAAMLEDVLFQYKSLKDDRGIQDCIFELSKCYLDLKNGQKAISLISSYRSDNKINQAAAYRHAAKIYKQIGDRESADKMILKAIDLSIQHHNKYTAKGIIADDVRKLYFERYDMYMNMGRYEDATAITIEQIKMMDKNGINPEDPNYQRVVAYHIDASLASNRDFVSLDDKCQNLVKHINSFSVDELATHPTVQAELLAGAKYCIATDQWATAQKLLSAYDKRTLKANKEIPHYLTLSGDLLRVQGYNRKSAYQYVDAASKCMTVIEKIAPALSLNELVCKDNYTSYWISLESLSYNMKSFGDKNNVIRLKAYGNLFWANALKAHLDDKNTKLKEAELAFCNDGNIHQLYDSAMHYMSQTKDKAGQILAMQYYAKFLKERKHFNEALKLYDTAINSNITVPNSSQDFDLKYHRAEIYDLVNNPRKAIKDYNKAIDILRQRIKRTFIFLTERQREGFWAQQQPLFKALSHDSGNSRGELRYNAALLNKNLLLSSASRLRGIVEASGDETLIADFRRLRDAVGMGVPADSIEALERSIQSRSEAYGSYTSAVDIDMKSVQSVLAANECAIEIVPSMRDSISGYDALVLSHEGVSVVPLFTENEITAALSGDIYDKSSKFGQSLWQKLSKAIGKSRRIYISPDGPFHSIAFEYLSVDGKHRANEVYDISRVSSTREICLGAQKRAIDGGALFGGIDYNLDSEDKQLALEEAGLVRGHVGENLGKDVMPWLFLPGTLGEVRDIDKSLEKAGKHSRLFTSDLALEEAFYSLSGKSPSILHIATHGFYLPQYQGANPLSKTGLVMAGANHYWREGWNLAPEPHDGILTGTEIAGLDLGNTDLVVLSACQSGLGDVSAEGVFGLPRAFKKSGAGSILMSLWPVHDDATRMLMDEFYKSLLSGNTKQQSLLDAQAAVKRAKFTTPSGTRESGSNPKYWAAFVLLD